MCRVRFLLIGDLALLSPVRWSVPEDHLLWLPGWLQWDCTTFTSRLGTIIRTTEGCCGRPFICQTSLVPCLPRGISYLLIVAIRARLHYDARRNFASYLRTSAKLYVRPANYRDCLIKYMPSVSSTDLCLRKYLDIINLFIDAISYRCSNRVNR